MTIEESTSNLSKPSDRPNKTGISGRRLVLMGIVVFLAGCVTGSHVATKRIGGLLVPASPKEFSIQLSANSSNSVRAVYLSDTQVNGVKYYGALILWDNGACFFTGGYTHPPEQELLDEFGFVGHYEIHNDVITVESLGFDAGGRRIVVEQGQIKGGTIIFDKTKFREDAGWSSEHKEYKVYPVKPFQRTSFW